MSRKKPPVPQVPVKQDVEKPQEVKEPEVSSMPMPPAPEPEKVPEIVLGPPVHASEVVKPKEELPVKKPVAIPVTALRDGFYCRVRKFTGDKFTLQSMKELGSWMKLDDVKLEAERQKKIKLAKAGR